MKDPNTVINNGDRTHMIYNILILPNLLSVKETDF